MKLNQVCLIGEWDNRNYGDLIIELCMKSLINKFFTDAKIVSIPVTRGYETPNFRKNKEEVTRVANQSDLTILGGGGIMHFAINKAAVDWNEIKTPFMVYAVGFNSFGEPFLPEWEQPFKEARHKAIYFSVRDDGTNELTHFKTKFDVSRDPALWADGIFDLKRQIQEKYIVINLAYGCWHARWGKQTKMQVDELFRDAVVHLNKCGYKVVFLAHRKCDEGCYETVRHCNVELIKWKTIMEHPEFGLSLYKYADFVIASRGHSQIIPLGFNVPVITISTQPKNKNRAEEFGLGKFSLDAKTLSKEDIASVIDEMIKYKEFQTYHLRLITQRFWKETVDEWEYIKIWAEKRIMFSSDTGIEVVPMWSSWLHCDFWKRYDEKQKDIPDLSQYNILMLYFIRTNELSLVTKIKEKYPHLKIVVLTDSDFWWTITPWLFNVDAKTIPSDILQGLKDADVVLALNPLSHKYYKENGINSVLDFFIARIANYVPPKVKSYHERNKEKKAVVMFHSMPAYKIKSNLQVIKALGLKPVVIGTFQSEEMLVNAVKEVGFDNYEVHTRFADSDVKGYMEKINECLIAFDDWYTGGSRFVIECGLCGVPVIGSENVLSLNILSPENTCPNADIGCLTKKAIALINNEHLYTELSSKIRWKAQTYFSPIETRIRLLKVLRKLYIGQ